MSVPLPSKQDLAVRRGPTIGNATTVVVAMQSRRYELGQSLLAELSESLLGLQSTEKVELAPPRRGKRRSREDVILTVYFAVGVSVNKAEKAVRRVLYELIRRVNHTRPMRRLEHRKTRREQKRRDRVETLERWLAPAR